MLQEERAIAVSGIADALRRSPVVFGLAVVLSVEAMAIAGLAWVALQDGSTARNRVAHLTEQLVECHRQKR